MTELKVDLGERSYPIKIGSGLLKTESLKAFVKGHQVLVVTNECIEPLYLGDILENFAGNELQVQSLVLPDGERYKNLETLNRIFDSLTQHRHNRTTTLVALGGGVIGDMVGFAAASYQRGVNFIQIPTTLLSQVDSSVGGKTAVNHPAGKNMIGAFYQPKAVIIDTETLKTLPDREFSAGMAEVIKYGLIADRDFFSWLERNIGRLMSRDEEALSHAIAVSCQTKANIVALDETEQGMRAILNLGHTFGHAIEAFQEYKGWLHGEAVGAGMVMAAELSKRMGHLDEQDFMRTKSLIAMANLPDKPPEGISKEQFLGLMGLDKKVLDGRLRLVLLRSLGEAYTTSEFPMHELESLLTG